MKSIEYSSNDFSPLQVPASSVIVNGTPALNRVSWTQSGLHVTTGDDSGKIHVYDVGEHLALPGADEWSKMANALNEMKNNQQEEDIESKIMAGAVTTASGHYLAGAGTGVGGGGGSGPGSLTSLPSLSGSPMR